MDFIITSAGLMGILCPIYMAEESYKTRRDFWIDLEIRCTVVSSSIGLSFLFLFYSGVLGPPTTLYHRLDLLCLPELDGLAGLQALRLAQNEEGMAGSGLLLLRILSS